MIGNAQVNKLDYYEVFTRHYPSNIRRTLNISTDDSPTHCIKIKY